MSQEKAVADDAGDQGEVMPGEEVPPFDFERPQRHTPRSSKHAWHEHEVHKYRDTHKKHEAKHVTKHEEKHVVKHEIKHEAKVEHAAENEEKHKTHHKLVHKTAGKHDAHKDDKDNHNIHHASDKPHDSDKAISNDKDKAKGSDGSHDEKNETKEKHSKGHRSPERHHRADHPDSHHLKGKEHKHHTPDSDAGQTDKHEEQQEPVHKVKGHHKSPTRHRRDSHGHKDAHSDNKKGNPAPDDQGSESNSNPKHEDDASHESRGTHKSPSRPQHHRPSVEHAAAKPHTHAGERHPKGDEDHNVAHFLHDIHHPHRVHHKSEGDNAHERNDKHEAEDHETAPNAELSESHNPGHKKEDGHDKDESTHTKGKHVTHNPHQTKRVTATHDPHSQHGTAKHHVKKHHENDGETNLEGEFGERPHVSREDTELEIPTESKQHSPRDKRANPHGHHGGHEGKPLGRDINVQEWAHQSPDALNRYIPPAPMEGNKEDHHHHHHWTEATEASPLDHTANLEREEKPYAVQTCSMHVDRGGEKECWITGCAVISPNHVVVADYNNNRVKVISVARHETLTRIVLPTSPKDVTMVNKELLAVTLPAIDTIQLLNVAKGLLPLLDLGKSFKVNGYCNGIDYADGELFVSFTSPPKVEIFSLEGKIRASITASAMGLPLFKFPSYIVSYHDAIFVSDSHRNAVIKVSRRGDVLGTYLDVDLKNPQGITVTPSGELLVCGQDTHNVHLITTDCATVSVFLDKTDGIFWPHVIDLCPETHTIYISSTSGDPNVDNFMKLFSFSDIRPLSMRLMGIHMH